MSQSDEKNDMSNALLDINSLSYEAPPEVTLAISSTSHTDFPQNSTSVYTTPMTFDSSISGNTFVDGRCSYLRFDVASNIPGFMGVGGASALIKTIVISSQNVEICRLENFNLLTTYRILYEMKADFTDSDAQAMGCYSYTQTSAEVGNAPKRALTSPDFLDQAEVDAVAKTYCIPLKLIPLFESEQLLPPQLMSKLRIVITWDLPSRCLGKPNTALAPAVGTYTISNALIRWKTHQIADQFARKISMITAERGLFMFVPEYYSDESNINSSSVNYRFDKSVSRAVQFMNINRPESSAVGNAAVDVHPFDSVAFDVKTFQAHAGSVYYPVDKLTTTGGVDPTSNTASEFYQYTLDAVACGTGSSSINYARFVRGYNPIADCYTYFGAKGMMVVDLRLSRNHAYSGIQINSSIALMVNMTTTAGDKHVNRFLKYMRILEVFANNIKVAD